ncbi:MAG: nitrogenase component 1 [Candidatus Bathyarchaeia archaeon]|jgi:light-independent protochlorophyllide reductase B subunit
MMQNSSSSVHRPDSLAGAVTAFEGINNACALINGPLGCRVYMAYIIQIQDPQATHIDTDVYVSDFYFGQPRAPATFLDEYDYVNSTEQKVKAALSQLSKWNHALVGIINSPGTSLIGDDLVNIVNKINPKFPTVSIESTAFTGTFADGFKRSTIEILKKVMKGNHRKIPKSVNLIGANIFQYNWENDLDEIKRTLNLMGIKVVSTICAGETLGNLEQTGNAELDVVLYEEYGNSIAAFLEKEYGIPAVGIKEPAPFGLTAAENWFASIASHFGISNQVIEQESKKIRMKCYRTLERVSQLTDGAKGKTFAVFGDSSVVAPLTIFLHRYLGIYPEIIGLREVGPQNQALIENYISENSLDTVCLFNPDQYEIRNNLTSRSPDLIFGSVIEERISKILKSKQEFIPISFPYTEKIMLSYRPLIGFNGVLTLIEDTLNSIKEIES